MSTDAALTTNETFTLPSGRTAQIGKFLGKHVREAQLRANDNDDASSLIFIVISMLATIDGAKIVPEDLDAMDGQDVLALMGKFTAVNFR